MQEHKRSELDLIGHRLSKIPIGESPISTGLRRELIESGLSPEKIAARSRVSPSTVRRFLFIGGNISLRNADRLAEMLRIEWGYDHPE